ICVTRLSETSSTVTGSESPSSVKTRVMPTLRPTNPKVISYPSFKGADCYGSAAKFLRLPFLQLDLDIDSGRQVELHQRVHRLVGGVADVHHAQVRPDLGPVARGLVRGRAAQHGEALDARRQRHRPLHDGPGALGRIHVLERRLVDQAVVERLESDPDFLALYGHIIRSLSRPRPRRRSCRPRGWQTSSPAPSQWARSASPPSSRCPPASPSRSPQAARSCPSRPWCGSRTAAGTPGRTACAAPPLPCSTRTPRTRTSGPGRSRPASRAPAPAPPLPPCGPSRAPPYC